MEGDTRERILHAALALFAQRGYAGTSMSDIAGALGLSKAALYRHFESKQAILDAIVARMEEQDGEHARQSGVPEDMPETDACRATEIAQLCAFAKDMFRYWTRDPFASAFRRVLTLEQYRDADMARMLSQMLSAGPLEYVAALLAGRADDPQAAALDLYGPMFLLYSVYDGAQDDAQRQAVTAALDAHIDRFCGKWEGKA